MKIWRVPARIMGYTLKEETCTKEKGWNAVKWTASQVRPRIKRPPAHLELRAPPMNLHTTGKAEKLPHSRHAHMPVSTKGSAATHLSVRQLIETLFSNKKNTIVQKPSISWLCGSKGTGATRVETKRYYPTNTDTLLRTRDSSQKLSWKPCFFAFFWFFPVEFAAPGLQFEAQTFFRGHIGKQNGDIESEKIFPRIALV